MEPINNIVTEASDQNIAFVRTSVYSFIKHNRWFSGTLHLLTHPNLPLSQASINSIRSIYNKLSIISTSASPLIIRLLELKKSFPQAELQKFLKYSIFFNKLESIFYFNSKSLFTKDIREHLYYSNTLADDDFNYIYKSVNICIDLNLIDSCNLTNEFFFSRDFKNLIFDLVKLNENFYSDSSLFPDTKFKQLSNRLTQVSAILFNNTTNDRLSKVNKIWLQKNKEVTLLLNKPINSVKNNNLKTIEKINLIQTLKKSIFEDHHKIVSYFNNKTICLVANSSELLKHEYGKLIDSHDIIVRFNGYKIIEEKTGFRTDVHCVFRDYIIPSNDHIDYKMIVSSNLKKWSESILKYHEKEALVKGYKIIKFNYPNRIQLISSKLGNIKIPTSGLVFFSFLNSIGVSKNVSLIGFNAYNGGDNSTILRNNNHSALSSAHDYALEFRYLFNNFNEILPGVLKYKY
jgi:hypothetical protein